MTRKIILAGVLGATLSGCIGGDSGSSTIASAAKTISQYVSNIGQLRLKPGTFESQSNSTISEAASFTANFADRTPDQLAKNLDAFQQGLGTIPSRAFNPKTDVVEFFGGTLAVDTSQFSSSTYLTSVVFGNTSMASDYKTGTTDEAGLINIQLSLKALSIGNLIAQSKAEKASWINISANSSYFSQSLDWNTALIENTTITFGEKTYLTMVSDYNNPIAIYTTALSDNGIIIHQDHDLTVPTNFTLMLKSKTAALNLGSKKLTNQGTIILTDGKITASSVECSPYGDLLKTSFLAAVKSTVGLKENFLQTTQEWQTLNSSLYLYSPFEGFFFMSGGNITGTVTGDRLSFLFGGELTQAFTNNGIVFMSNSTENMKSKLLSQLSALNISKTDSNYQLVSVLKEVVELMKDSAPILQATTNNGVFLMSGGEIKDAFQNKGIIMADGGTCLGKLTNNGTLSVIRSTNGLFATIQKTAGDQIPAEYQPLIQAFIPTSDPTFQDIFNGGTLTVDGGNFKNIENQGGVFVFGGAQLQDLPSGDASVENLTFDSQSTAILVTGHTLRAKSATFASSPDYPNIFIKVTDNNQRTILESSGDINLGAVKISVGAANTQVIPSGTVITLANITGTGTLTFTGALEDSSEFTLKKTANKLTLIASKDIAAQTTTVTVSKTISDVGGFRPHKAGKLVGATQSSVAGATFSVAGDMNVSNGFSANNAEVQMKMGSITLTSNFTKTAGMNLSGTFAAFNAIDVAGVTLTNSVSFATKGDLKTSSFNETGFMSAVSKDLGSDGFSFTPSVSVGFSKLSDVSVQVDGYSVQGASAGAYLADFSVDAGHAFKVSGISMNVSGGISFGVKSAQSFELHNAAGQTMNATTADRNVGLSFGFTAKLDAKTSFYANAKTASYNNAKTLEVGFKF